MKIGELARRARVSTDTLRHYESLGLLRTERRRNGYRDFPEGAPEVVRIIRLAQSLGFSLREVGSVLSGLGETLSSEQVRDLLSAKLADIDERLAALTELRGLLTDRLARSCPLDLTAPAVDELPGAIGRRRR
jgi:DNA-binding transcriptional MerR regulator